METPPAIEEERRYEASTIQSKNIFARVAQRSRIFKAVKLSLRELKDGKLLDYGCGTGVFVHVINSLKNNIAIGYEPYQKGRFNKNVSIASDFLDVQKHAPFQCITIFETIEHLNNEDFEEFLLRTDSILSEDGVILMSVPIEIGLGLLVKEIYRSKGNFLYHKEYTLLELIKAAILGMPGSRIVNNGGYSSHKGFDFRKLLHDLKGRGYEAKIIAYTPFPIKTWYINSQCFIRAKKRYT